MPSWPPSPLLRTTGTVRGTTPSPTAIPQSRKIMELGLLSMNRGPDAPGEDHPPKPEAAKPMLNAAYLSAAFPPADAARRAGRQFLGLKSPGYRVHSAP